MLRGVAPWIVMLAGFPAVVASCHIVGGLQDHEIDPNFDKQGSGGDGGNTSPGVGGDGGAATTVGTGGSGGQPECTQSSQCDPAASECQRVECIDLTCQLRNENPLEACSIGYCDGLGVCFECLDDTSTPCPNMGKCTDHRCFDADCTDTVKNGAETDTDCGGSVCGGCALTKACLIDGDCISKICRMQTCQSCDVHGCGNGEYCDTGNGRCEDLKFPGEGCDNGYECWSGTCTVVKLCSL
jgi:hypothetical protein